MMDPTKTRTYEALSAEGRAQVDAWVADQNAATQKLLDRLYAEERDAAYRDREGKFSEVVAQIPPCPSCGTRRIGRDSRSLQFGRAIGYEMYDIDLSPFGRIEVTGPYTTTAAMLLVKEKGEIRTIDGVLMNLLYCQVCNRDYPAGTFDPTTME